ncbi:hypothetical protein Q5495_16940, partial [Escherichia coli]|nr:hypothetical protein [Escherichia coli]
HIDIQFLFSGVDTDIMKFMFHSETNLANTDYRENRSRYCPVYHFGRKAVRCINLRNRLEPKARYGIRTAGRENWPIFSALEG